MSEKAGAINVYVCQSCGTEVVTRNKHDGTTPFMVGCVACPGVSYSSFYRVDQTLTPTHEWFKPMTAGERKRWMRDPDTAEHVRLGGLCLRTLAGEKVTF